MARLKVGINGFGRIGQMIFRAGFDDIEIVGINNLSKPENTAYYLKYDSTHGRYKYDVSSNSEGLEVNGQKVKMSAERDPANIPWKDWGADLVLECTGAFKNKEDFTKHIAAGAKKVLVSAPAKGADLTIVYGINHKDYDPAKHEVISNASCTTNCLAPVAKVLHSEFGIEQGFMTTIHSYTNDQRVLDGSHPKDLRRSRGAAQSMIPTSTGAAIAVGQVLPELKGLIDGCSIRVPTPDVSIVDLVVKTKKSVSVQSINDSLIKAAGGEFKNIINCESQPLVSADYIGDRYSSTVDLPNTMVLGENMAKVFSWYDNEMGYSSRMVDMALHMMEKGL